jgi:WD40 repeat protein
MISLSDGSIEELPFDPYAWSGAIDPTGRYIAVGYQDYPGGPPSYVHVLDLETREIQRLEFGQGFVNDLQFTPTGDLLSVHGGRLVRWNLRDGGHELLLERVRRFKLSPDGRSLLVISPNWRAVFHDLETGASRELSSHGSGIHQVAFDVSGTLAITGDHRGAVRVGPVTGEEPHVLLRHQGPLAITPSTTMLAVDPLGRWIASTAESESRVVLWPMPKGEPILGLPSKEFLARLKTLTNIRVVPREASPTGYDIEFAPFPGWETPPTW